MAEINLVRSLPESKRNISKRRDAKSEEAIQLSRQFGFDYFDGSRDVGYGGYRYDGRWRPVAQDMADHYGLKKGDKVLDIGAAKGFLVKDFLEIGIDAYGLDVSEYALLHCEPDVVGRMHLGNALKLPFPDDSFDVVLSLNTLHNLDEDGVVQALREIDRVSRKGAFITVDSYRTEEEKDIFESWVLTAFTYGFPHEWIDIFNKAAYKGDYYWTFITGESDSKEAE